MKFHDTLDSYIKDILARQLVKELIRSGMVSIRKTQIPMSASFNSGISYTEFQAYIAVQKISDTQQESPFI